MLVVTRDLGQDFAGEMESALPSMERAHSDARLGADTRIARSVGVGGVSPAAAEGPNFNGITGRQGPTR